MCDDLKRARPLVKNCTAISEIRGKNVGAGSGLMNVRKFHSLNLYRKTLYLQLKGQRFDSYIKYEASS